MTRMRTKKEMLDREAHPEDVFSPAYLVMIPPKEERPPTWFGRLKSRLDIWFMG